MKILSPDVAETVDTKHVKVNQHHNFLQVVDRLEFTRTRKKHVFNMFKKRNIDENGKQVFEGKKKWEED